MTLVEPRSRPTVGAARSASRRAEMCSAFAPTKEEWERGEAQRVFEASVIVEPPSAPSPEPAPEPLTVYRLLEGITNTNHRAQVANAVRDLERAGFDEVSIVRILTFQSPRERRLATTVDDRVLKLLARGPIESTEGDVVALLARRLDVAVSSITQALVRLDRAGAVIRDCRRGVGVFRVELVDA